MKEEVGEKEEDVKEEVKDGDEKDEKEEEKEEVKEEKEEREEEKEEEKEDEKDNNTPAENDNTEENEDDDNKSHLRSENNDPYHITYKRPSRDHQSVTVLDEEETNEVVEDPSIDINLRLIPLSISSTSITIELGVDQPARVWCTGLLSGHTLNKEFVMNNKDPILVQERSHVTISGLLPGHGYQIICFGLHGRQASYRMVTSNRRHGKLLRRSRDHAHRPEASLEDQRVGDGQRRYLRSGDVSSVQRTE